MAEFLDIRFVFSCRTSHKNAEGKSPLVLRIIYRGERRDIFTGLYCKGTNWNSKNQKVRKEIGFDSINQNLQLILRKAADAFDYLKFSGNEFTIGDIVDKIKGNEVRPTLLIEFLEEGNQKMQKKVGTDILHVTYMKYKRGLSYMKDFLMKEYKVKNMSLQKLNADFIEKYFQYLRTEKSIAHNTACKYLTCVRTILLPAIRSGVLKNDPFYGLRITSKPVSKSFLTQDEINKIAQVELNDPDLERKRDIFLFACYTGLAYVDLHQLAESHLIRESDGSWYIKKPRQKTGQESIIPLLPAAEKILIKYSPNGKLEDFDWYVSTNQKMNKGLKYIGKRAGLIKELHMHLARHTFATTVTLANGVPIETVSKMLGHASIKQTQHYAKVVPLKIKHDMEKIRQLYS